MAYVKTTWVDKIVQFANRYTKSGETSSEVTLVQSPGTVTAAGTAVNAARMNKIEQGIADALPKDGSEPMTGHIVAPFGINANLADNYRLHGDKPSDYPQGISTFFANNAGAWAGGAVYGTVQTIKGFIGQTSMTQYFLPYVTDAPIKYRNGLFGTDTWTEWRTLWDTSQLRDNAGVLEFFTGGAWRPVGGIKNVQRGTAQLTTGASSVNVTISTVNLNKSYILVSAKGTNRDTTDSAASIVAAKFNTSSEINLSATMWANGSATAEWQVVESY